MRINLFKLFSTKIIEQAKLSREELLRKKKSSDSYLSILKWVSFASTKTMLLLPKNTNSDFVLLCIYLFVFEKKKDLMLVCLMLGDENCCSVWRFSSTEEVLG